MDSQGNLNKPFSKEFEALTAICSTSFNEGKIDNYVEGIEWNEFISHCHKHRLNFLVAQKLKETNISVPSEIQQTLFTRVNQASKKNLIFTAELCRINKLFQQQEINLIWLKGPLGALQVYGDFAAKESRDIDVLIDETTIENSLQLLIDEGYELTYSYLNLNQAQKSYFRKVNNQLVLFHPKKRVQLEIHWRFFANPYLLPYTFNELLKEGEKVEIGGQLINGLGRKHLLIYLCTHGAKHAWSKLYWLVEVLYLLNKIENHNIIIEEAKRMGVERIYMQALHLLKTIFNHKVDPILSIDKEIKLLVENSLQAIQASNDLKPFTEIKNLENKYRLILKDDFKYKKAENKLLSVNDFTTLHLPEFLFFLYYPLRPFIWILRKFKK